MNARGYMLARLQLLQEGKVLTGTPEEYIERHDQAQRDLLRLRAQNARREADQNLDLVG